MLHRLAIALFAFLMPLSAFAQEMEGTWDFRLAETTIFRFEIAENEDGTWHGTWSRPASFASDGDHFARLRGGVKKVQSMAGYEFLGDIELSFADDRPGAVPDIFRFTQKGPDMLEMLYVGTELEPYTLVRADSDDPIGDWEDAAIYRRPPDDNSADGEVRVREPAPGIRDFQLRLDLTRPGSAGEDAAPDAAPDEETAAGNQGAAEADQAIEPRPQIEDDFLEGL